MTTNIYGFPLWLIIVVGVLVISFIIYLIIRALREGREISFWPPRIGPKVITEPTESTTASKSRTDKSEPRRIPSTEPSTAQVRVTEEGASGSVQGPGFGSAWSVSDSIDGGGITVEPGEILRIEVPDGRGGKKFYTERNRGYHYEAPKSKHSEHHAEAHSASPSFEALSGYEKNQADGFSREIAKPHLNPDERLIKAFIGKIDYTRDTHAFISSLDEMKIQVIWACVALTNLNLLILGLDDWRRVVIRKRFPFIEVKNAYYSISKDVDRFHIELFTGDTINLYVPLPFRKQAKDVVAVFNRGR